MHRLGIFSAKAGARELPGVQLLVEAYKVSVNPLAELQNDRTD
jgi:hypothetical protein